MDKKNNKNWIFGLILGVAVAAGLSVSLESTAVAVGAGVAVGLPMAVGLYSREQRKSDREPREK